MAHDLQCSNCPFFVLRSLRHGDKVSPLSKSELWGRFELPLPKDFRHAHNSDTCVSLPIVENRSLTKPGQLLQALNQIVSRLCPPNVQLQCAMPFHRHFVGLIDNLPYPATKCLTILNHV